MSIALSIIAIIISAGSLLFAIWSFCKSHSVEKRQLEIEEARESEKKKANLTARIIDEQTARRTGDRIFHKYFLLVENKGYSEARNIILLLGGKSVLESPVIQENKEEIKQVGPQSPIKYELSNGYRSHLPLQVVISWEDDSGIKGNYNTTLT
jgi:hypothetical protein